METTKLDYPGFPSKVPPRIVEIIHGDAPSVVAGKSPYEWKLVTTAKNPDEDGIMDYVYEGPLEPIPIKDTGKGVLPQLREAVRVYTYSDLKRAYEAGVDREYSCNGCGYGGFELWFKDEFKSEINEHNDSE